MRMSDLRKIEERCQVASDRVDEFCVAIAQDIANWKESEAELKHAINGIMATKSSVSDLVAMATEMVFRLASGWPYAPESLPPAGIEQVVDTEGRVVSVHVNHPVTPEEGEDDGENTEAGQEVLSH